MTDIDTDDKRAGTAVTFTGKGSRETDLKQRLALIVPSIVTVCALGAAAWYLMVRPAAPHTAPAQPVPALPAGPAPSTTVPKPELPPPPLSIPASNASAPRRADGAQRPPVLPPSQTSRPVQSAAPRTPGPTAAKHPTQVAVPDSRSRDRGAPPRFHVQAGSFADRGNAVALMTQLRAHGYAVALAEGALYRVWVGGYVDRDTADRLAATLRADGFDATLTLR